MGCVDTIAIKINKKIELDNKKDIPLKWKIQIEKKKNEKCRSRIDSEHKNEQIRRKYKKFYQIKKGNHNL